MSQRIKQIDSLTAQLKQADQYVAALLLVSALLLLFVIGLVIGVLHRG